MTGSSLPARARLARAARIAAAALVLGTLGLGAWACGGGAPAPSSCPNDAPDTCPAGAATFAATVQPLLQSRCGACHVAGGVEAVRPMQTYDQVKKQTMDMFLSISACIMPPADQPQPTSEERQAIMGWIVCGAMND